MKFPTFQAGRDNSKRYVNKSVSSTICLFLCHNHCLKFDCKDTNFFQYGQNNIEDSYRFEHGRKVTIKIQNANFCGCNPQKIIIFC